MLPSFNLLNIPPRAEMTAVRYSQTLSLTFAMINLGYSWLTALKLHTHAHATYSRLKAENCPKAFSARLLDAH